jgi:2,5-diamino-6-(ribosylamino)-4(3H)-pyrimidinone 5'-phosphate reductase
MSGAGDIYQDLAFPSAPSDRPYTFINMVATIDGKTVSGHRGEDVLDLGSDADHLLMRRIQDQADGVFIGATTLRAADKRWDPKTRFRVVASNSGDVDYGLPYFQGGGQGYIATSEASTFKTEKGVERLEAGKDKLDLVLLLKKLRDLGSERLLCFGGSELNGQLLTLDLIDELFLTISPKVKLGRDVPTYAGGEPLPRDHMLDFDLKESHTVGNDVFLRYRRHA